MTTPRWLRLLAALLVRGPRREFILGDLDELYAGWCRTSGRGRAVARYAWAMLVSAMVEGRPRGRLRSPRVFLAQSASVLRDARRACLGKPLFVLVVATTLGIGVGSAGAVFGIVNQLFLRPVPGIGDPDGVSFLEFRTEEGPSTLVSWPDVQEIRRSSDLLANLAAFRSAHVLVAVDDEQPLQTRGFFVYGDYFEVLKLRPALGRLPSAEELALSADPFVAVISERLWASLFRSDPDVVGRRFEADGQHDFTVVGVVGDGFRGTDRFWPVDMWIPSAALVPLQSYPADRLRSVATGFMQFFLAGLRPGVSRSAATEQINEVLSAVSEQRSDPFLAGMRASLSRGIMRPDEERFFAAVAGGLGVLVLVVLLIPCANVANLLLVRTAYRRGEIAVRRALGASAARVAWQQGIEGLLLASLGATFGLAFAWLIGRSYRGQDPMGLPPLEGFILDERALLFALAAIVATTLAFGVGPSLSAARTDVSVNLKSAAKQATGREGRVHVGLSAGQIALSIPLLVGALLLGRTLQNISSFEPGIAIDDVYVAEVSVSSIRPTADEFDRIQRALVDAVRAVPGDHQVALAHVGPYAMMRPTVRVAVVGRSDDPVDADVRWASPGWLELLDAKIVSGRGFRPADWSTGGPPRVVVSNALAQRLFGSGDVVGRTVAFGLRDLVEAEIIGVLDDVRMADPRSGPDNVLLTSHAPLYLRGTATVHVRVPRSSPERLELIRDALQVAASPLAVPALTPLSTRVGTQLAEQRVLARLLTLLSALAVLVSAVGLYGVVAFGVANRSREFGIRMSLGASRRRIAALAMSVAASIIGGGALLGVIGAYGVSRLLASRLVGVEPLDAPSYLGALAILAAVAAVACMIPAHRAARLDPVATLTDE